MLFVKTVIFAFLGFGAMAFAAPVEAGVAATLNVADDCGRHRDERERRECERRDRDERDRRERDRERREREDRERRERDERERRDRERNDYEKLRRDCERDRRHDGPCRGF